MNDPYKLHDRKVVSGVHWGGTRCWGQIGVVSFSKHIHPHWVDSYVARVPLKAHEFMAMIASTESATEGQRTWTIDVSVAEVDQEVKGRMTYCKLMCVLNDARLDEENSNE